MSFEVKPNKSVSQPHFPEKTRGFSAFVALTAGRYAQLHSTCNRFRQYSWIVAASLLAAYFF